MAGKTASIRRPKRITAKQRVARKKNIAVARMHKKRGAKKTIPVKRKKKIVSKLTGKKPSGGGGFGRIKRTAVSKGMGGGKAVKKAAAKKYKKIVKANKGQGMSKDFAIRKAHKAAIKKARQLKGAKGQRGLMVAIKMAEVHAKGVARKRFKMDRSGARNFASGYLNSIMRDLN